ncbi:MAG: hypothetical protein CR972_03970 [Candidatus Moraniibacteriota bacterium]|nr:MAG: hypothetical protein CR972_03970 [Candidatus Moranbacteria bacterium]
MDVANIAKLLEIDEIYVYFYITGEIPPLNTPAEAQELYRTCRSDMKTVVMDKWIALVKQAIPKLRTPAEAQMLYKTCPPEMRSAIIKELYKHM